MTTVLNLATGAHIEYSCTPREAVIAAHAQKPDVPQPKSGATGKDWATWDYEARYGHLVLTGKHSVACGDYAALL